MAALAEAAPAEGFSLLKGMSFHPYSFQVLSQKDWLEFSITVFIIQHSVYKDDRWKWDVIFASSSLKN